MNTQQLSFLPEMNPLAAHDKLTQQRIQNLARQVMNDSDIFKYLAVPSVSFEGLPDTEQIEIDQPILLSEIHKEEWAQPLIQEVVAFWALLWNKGIALYDFKLFRQRTGKVYLYNFERFGFRQQIGSSETITFPFPMNSPLQYFFHHPCFSPCFEWRLQTLPESFGMKPIDMSKILNKE